jgi:hypothetical protein
VTGVTLPPGPPEPRSPEPAPNPLADLIADCADVRRRLLTLRPALPRQRTTVEIPDRAVSLVEDLEPYGD